LISIMPTILTALTTRAGPAPWRQLKIG